MQSSLNKFFTLAFTHGLLVNADNSKSRGREFKPQHRILDGYVMLIVSPDITLLQPLTDVFYTVDRFGK